MIKSMQIKIKLHAAFALIATCVMMAPHEQGFQFNPPDRAATSFATEHTFIPPYGFKVSDTKPPPVCASNTVGPLQKGRIAAIFPVLSGDFAEVPEKDTILRFLPDGPCWTVDYVLELNEGLTEPHRYPLRIGVIGETDREKVEKIGHQVLRDVLELLKTVSSDPNNPLKYMITAPGSSFNVTDFTVHKEIDERLEPVCQYTLIFSYGDLVSRLSISFDVFSLDELKLVMPKDKYKAAYVVTGRRVSLQELPREYSFPLPDNVGPRSSRARELYASLFMFMWMADPYELDRDSFLGLHLPDLEREHGRVDLIRGLHEFIRQYATVRENDRVKQVPPLADRVASLLERLGQCLNDDDRTEGWEAREVSSILGSIKNVNLMRGDCIEGNEARILGYVLYALAIRRQEQL